MDFVWVLTGGYNDAHCGENKVYSLVEYDTVDKSLRLSNIKNSSVPWTRDYLNDLPNHIMKIVQQSLEIGTLFLCHAGSYEFGDYGYMERDGFHIFNETDKTEIRQKLMELLMSECLG